MSCELADIIVKRSLKIRESLKVSSICDSQSLRGKCLDPAVKIPYRRPCLALRIWWCVILAQTCEYYIDTVSAIMRAKRGVIRFNTELNTSRASPCLGPASKNKHKHLQNKQPFPSSPPPPRHPAVVSLQLHIKALISRRVTDHRGFIIPALYGQGAPPKCVPRERVCHQEGHMEAGWSRVCRWVVSKDNIFFLQMYSQICLHWGVGGRCVVGWDA